mmetsp:Transcript_16093/g.39413  ORF Transcript_16093/g.39413 Transcript_16093/m.39413 type:complete len:391 (+) Transcript_16093:45-1217(+)
MAKTHEPRPSDNHNNNGDAPAKNNNASWIRLTHGKELSRLLYPNPVCFLCTTTSNPSSQDDASSNLWQRNTMVISWLSAIDNDGYFVMSVNARRHSVNHLLESTRESVDTEMADNTYTPNNKNDDGPITFTLCVPTVEMKDLVLQVGGVSGKDHCKFGNTISSMVDAADANIAHMSKRKRRKLQKQRLEAGEGISGLVALPYGLYDSSRHSNEIQGHEQHNTMLAGDDVKIATKADKNNEIQVTDDGNLLFVIEGTVAHMKCQIQSLLLKHPKSTKSDHRHQSMHCDDSIDKGESSNEQDQTQEQMHYVFLAKLVDAYCQEQYWDSNKSLFCAKEEVKGRPNGVNADQGGESETTKPSQSHSGSSLSTVPPYLTFLGSQTFGQVLPLLPR